ncbi:helix-turn-helix transcriptional regulator [uncultured Maribacter sp.]|uniref:helix-turn-helix domain-containing protein n=1 Tax=uncultured Maribacter sp. TaxID=431308 RepID=UPI0026335403|nr:helix-turn-helix transcriptional regulator [uncultured Maribacter sp.]
MVNKENFIKRLTQILKYHDLSASTFADKINVQRSSISHLLSGRNNPSLDFVLRVVNVFPEVNLYWLLKGEGSFPANEKKLNSTSPILSKNVSKEKPDDLTESKSIEKIVFFYTDGTFKSFKG